MPEVKILVPVRAKPETVMSMTVEGEQGSLTFHTTPPAINGTFGTWRIHETERPGMNPATYAAAPGNRTVSFDHKVWAINPYDSIRSLITPLRAAAEKGKRVKFAGGGTVIDGSWWWVKSVDLTEDAKARNGEPSRVTLSWSLAQASIVSKVELSKTEVAKDTTSPADRPHLLFDSEGNRAPSTPPTAAPTPGGTRPGDNRTEF